MSNLDRPLGDIIKANKKRQAPKGGRQSGGGAIAKGGQRQQGNASSKKQGGGGGRQQQQQNGGGNQKASSRKPRQQAKTVPVQQMRAQGKQQNRNIAANRQQTGRAQKLNQKRGLTGGATVPAGATTLLVIQSPDGRQTIQPVALVQTPGQAAPQVIATGAAQRPAGQPLFSVASRQQRQSGGGQQQGGQRRQSAGGQGGNRQSGNRQSGNRQGGRRN